MRRLYSKVARFNVLYTKDFLFLPRIFFLLFTYDMWYSF